MCGAVPQALEQGEETCQACLCRWQSQGAPPDQGSSQLAALDKAAPASGLPGAGDRQTHWENPPGKVNIARRS